MKRILIAAAVVTATASFSAPAFASDVGVSISIGQPGFYGQLDIGGYPQPEVIYAQPVVIDQRPSYGPPVYLRVPPGHAKHWSKHCREYNACGERVYFVQDNWYNREYAPHYQEHHQNGQRDQHGDNNHGDHGNNGNHGNNGDNGKHGRGD